MMMRVSELLISCHRYQEVVDFDRINYFYGKMGAGKSSIARLVDFCFGGDLELTPALQSEFVSARLSLSINRNNLTIERRGGSGIVRAQWHKDGELFDVALPARKPGPEVIPGTGIEVLSDLFFHLANRTPPRVRRSKRNADSDLERLSMRDLLWYCYLDQNTIDSVFFHLDEDGDVWKRNKSRDVLRFIVGFHQERVAELESQIDALHARRVKLHAGAEALRQALVEAKLETELEIDARVAEMNNDRAKLVRQLSASRSRAQEVSTSGTDQLRERGRRLGASIEAAEEMVADLESVKANDRRHLNELLSLSTKFRRMTSARAVLNGVAFVSCPRCTQCLPERSAEQCSVCGQPDSFHSLTDEDSDRTQKDVDARVAELRDTLAQRDVRKVEIERQLSSLRQQKQVNDRDLTQALEQYDSTYLSLALNAEREKARIDAEMDQLERLRVFPKKVDDQTRMAEAIQSQETELRQELRAARSLAERDTANLRKLRALFLDCLVRAQLPGFSPEDDIQMNSPGFLPEVSNPSESGLIMTSFANLGSGGKKTLFKCCFALAMHRLAVQVGALLPSLIIIDSPMKNISERENVEQFEGFHRLVYELAEGELYDTQFIMIDKEVFMPPESSNLAVRVRYMTPGDKTNGPLLRGYRGH